MTLRPYVVMPPTYPMAALPTATAGIFIER